MNKTTILLLILSVVIAAGLSYFQYFYKAKSKSNLVNFLAALRFLAIFGILVLLINPIISKKTFETIKTPLVIAVDNSNSITDLKADGIAKEMYGKISFNADLKDKFDVQTYKFDGSKYVESGECFTKNAGYTDRGGTYRWYKTPKITKGCN